MVENPIRYTLIGDGPFERALLPVLDRLLLEFPEVDRRGLLPKFAELREIRQPPPRADLGGGARKAVDHSPCDLLVDRDAEAVPHRERIREIREQLGPLELEPYVPLVPVRMSEAWLLVDEQAIRSAADNPNGTVPLELPAPAELESLPDPKRVLHQALLAASETSGRRKKRFRRDLSTRALTPAPTATSEVAP